MQLYELLNNCLSLIENVKICEDKIDYPIVWPSNDKIYFISQHNIKQYHSYAEQIYGINKNIYTRFTRQKIYKFIDDEIFKIKKLNSSFTENTSKDFFEVLENQSPYSRYIVAPIFGVRLDSVEKINISLFEIGKKVVLIQCYLATKMGII